MARHISISDFLGLNNVDEPEALTVLTENFQTRYFLRTAKNIDINNDLKPRRRRGYDSIYTASAPHSLWSDEKDLCLFREGSYLKRLHSNLSTTSILRSGITGSLTTAYLSFIRNTVYYSDGNMKGVVEGGVNRSWGIEVPPQPIVSVISSGGSLLSGTYRVTTTYVRNDGQESGSSDITTIDVEDGQGIRIPITASSDSDVSKANVYVTKRDGDIFYRALSLSNTSRTVDYTDEDTLTALDCKTLLLSPPPAGQVLGYYNGRIYIGSFDIVWYTDPFRYELVNLATNYLPFSEDVTLIGPVKDGIYFGTDSEIVFGKGNDPKKLEWVQVADYGAIFGTMRTIEYTQRDGSIEKAVILASQKGICMGKPGGDFHNITEKTYRYDPSLTGTGLVRFTRGTQQYIAVLKGTDVENSENAYYE